MEYRIYFKGETKGQYLGYEPCDNITDCEEELIEADSEIETIEIYKDYLIDNQDCGTVTFFSNEDCSEVTQIVTDNCGNIESVWTCWAEEYEED